MVGRYDRLDPARPVLMVGSHIDTVPGAGKYDGVLGVLPRLAAVPALGGRRLPLGIDVIALMQCAEGGLTLSGFPGPLGRLIPNRACNPAAMASRC